MLASGAHSTETPNLRADDRAEFVLSYLLLLLLYLILPAYCEMYRYK